MNNSTKKTIQAFAIGILLASGAGQVVNAMDNDQNLSALSNDDTSNNSSYAQSIADTSDSSDDIKQKYGGCGLSCAGCTSKCF